jgi:hypothetical protein
MVYMHIHCPAVTGFRNVNGLGLLFVGYLRTLLNSVALVHKRTIPTERPRLVGEVSANLLRVEDVAWSAQRIPTDIRDLA